MQTSFLEELPVNISNSDLLLCENAVKKRCSGCKKDQDEQMGPLQ